jgi:hypothetical protein
VNKLVAVLAASTAVSASAALYWRHELIEERARHAQVEIPGPAPALAAASGPVKPAPVVQSVPGPAKPPAPTPRTSTPAPATNAKAADAANETSSAWPVDETRRAEVRKQGEQFLRKYDNPQGRQELRDQALASARRILKGFDKEASLDSVTFEKLIQLTAEQEVEKRAAQSRCLVDPQCEGPPPQYREMQERQRAELANLIGEDASREMHQWTASVGERRMAATLAGRLPANVPLSGTQSAALIDVLTTERRAIMQEYAATRQRMTGFGNVDGSSVMYVTDSPSIDDRVASARVNSQRLRDRAATVLSGEQLTLFNQMQDELLFDLQRHLKRQESERSGS